VLMAVYVVLFYSPALTSAQTDIPSPPKKVLLLNEPGPEFPNREVFLRGFQSVLRSGLPGSSEFYSENLETYRFPSESHEQLMRDYLRRKYSGMKFDVIAAWPEAALDFLLRYRDELFPGVPIVYITVKRPDSSKLPNDVTGIWVGTKVADTLEMALSLQPNTKRVFVVIGRLTNSGFLIEETKAQLQPFEQRVAIDYILNLPLDEVVSRVKELPPDSIVLNVSQTRGVGNKSATLYESVSLIAQSSNAPVYGIIDSWVGSGIVGGKVISMEWAGSELARIALLVANGTAPKDIPVQEAPTVPMFDWRQVQRWGIAEKNLPEGSSLKFYERTFWQEYRWSIVAAVLVILLQAILIVSLLLNRAQRRRAEVSRLRSEQNVQNLAGRLMNLQEQERHRIAGELHDGLGQSLAIIRNRATICLRDGVDRVILEEQLEEISSTALGAIDEVRKMAHNLRPYELDRLGLARAIESMVDKIGESTSIKLSARLDKIDGVLSPDAEMSIYRIVQEGLNNVINHAEATEAKVDLEHNENELIVTVADNGKGIETKSPRNGQGHGLTGIAERARMLGGTVKIDSRQGKGTILSVRLRLSEEENER